MTTAELARILQAYPQNLRVIGDGYEGGDDDLPPEQISPVRIAPNTGKHRWEGLHRGANGLTQETPR